MNIKKIREKLHYTQLEFAQLIGVHISAVNFWEMKKFKPSPKHTRKIIELLEAKGFKESDFLDNSN